MVAVYTLPEDGVGSYGVNVLNKLQKDSKDYTSNPVDMMNYYLGCSYVTFEVICTKKASTYEYHLRAHNNNWDKVFTQTSGNDMKEALRILDCKISETFALQRIDGVGKVTRKYMKAIQGFYDMAKGSSFSSNPVHFMMYYQKHAVNIELTVTRYGSKYVYEMKGFEDNRNRYLVRSMGEDLMEVTKDLDRRITGAVNCSKLVHGFDLKKVRYS